MATSDLMAHLDAFDGKVEEALQTQIRDAIIKELDDKSADVQTIAVSWYAICMRVFVYCHQFHIC
jgi:hypothetical protein